MGRLPLALGRKDGESRLRGRPQNGALALCSRGARGRALEEPAGPSGRGGGRQTPQTCLRGVVGVAGALFGSERPGTIRRSEWGRVEVLPLPAVAAGDIVRVSVSKGYLIRWWAWVSRSPGYTGPHIAGCGLCLGKSLGFQAVMR